MIKKLVKKLAHFFNVRCAMCEHNERMIQIQNKHIETQTKIIDNYYEQIIILRQLIKE